MDTGLAPTIPEHQLPTIPEHQLNAIKIECPPKAQKNQSMWKYKSLCYKIKSGIKEQWRENKEYVLTLPLLLAVVIVIIVVHVALVGAKRSRIATMITIASLLMIQLMHLVVIVAWKNLTPKSKHVYIAQVPLIAVMIVLYWVYDNNIGPSLAVIISLMSLMHGLSVIPTLLQRTRSDATLVPSSYGLDRDTMSVADDSFSRPYDPVAMLSRMDHYSRSITAYIHVMMQKEAMRNRALEETRAYLDALTALADLEAARANYEEARANKAAALEKKEAARAAELSAKIDDQLEVIKKLKIEIGLKD